MMVLLHPPHIRVCFLYRQRVIIKYTDQITGIKGMTRRLTTFEVILTVTKYDTLNSW